MSSEQFDAERYFSNKRSECWQAWVFMILGGVIFLDSGTPIPFPLTGLISVMLGGGLFGWGYRCYKNYKRLPLHEALQLGKQGQGRLTRTDLFLKLLLTPEQTDQVIEILIREGFIEALMDELPQEQEVVYKLL